MGPSLARRRSLAPTARKHPPRLAETESDAAGGGERSTRERAYRFAMLLGDRRFHFDRITIRDGVKDLAVPAPDGQLGGDVALEGRMISDSPNGHFALEVPAGE